MKRSIAIVLTLVIFAVVAVCFLRPTPTPKADRYVVSRDMYDRSPTQLMATVGRDAELFRIEKIYDDIHDQTGVLLKIYAAQPGKYYTLGVCRWRDGRSYGDSDKLGEVERFGENGWEHYEDVTELYGSSSMFTGRVDNLLSSDGCFIESGLPVWEPGHYRVLYTVRDYIPAQDAEDAEH